MPRVELPASSTVLHNLVGGTWVPSEGPLVPVTSPYSGAEIARAPRSSDEEVARVVEAAAAAQRGWQATPVKERAARLFALRETLLQHLAELGNLAAVESGKTVDEGRAEVLKGVEVLEFATSLQNHDTGRVLEVSRGVTCETRREPLGVVAGVTPFNFPAMVPMWMFPIALAVGNAFVWKPSEKVPLTANRVAALALESGLPPGVLSVVHGAREVVDALVAHPEVRAIGFVGSSPVAEHVYRTGAAQGKRVLALGGAKNHLLVVPDADPRVTVQAVVDSFTGCAGQRCMAASVLIAVGDVDPLVDAIVERAAGLSLGDRMGAIIDAASVARIEAAIAEASLSATLRLDGRGARPADPAYAGGSWLGPTILDHVRPDAPIRHTEVFGPVLAIVRARTLREAVEIQRDGVYGNAASVFTTSGAVAEYVAAHTRAGMIGVNVGVPVPREPFSFGGIGASRFGHGDITGDDGVAFWTQTKKVTRKWEPQSDTTWMG